MWQAELRRITTPKVDGTTLWLICLQCVIGEWQYKLRFWLRIRSLKKYEKCWSLNDSWVRLLS